jgi:transcriptional regulator with XRE-family HTH domain
MPKPVTPIRSALADSGLSQKEVAEAAGISPSRMSLIASGLHPAEPTRAAIAAALGRSTAELWPEPADLEAAA